MLPGKKSYILGALGAVWGLVGWIAGWLDAATAQEFIWAGLSVIALRLGITKNGQNR